MNSIFFRVNTPIVVCNLRLLKRIRICLKNGLLDKILVNLQGTGPRPFWLPLCFHRGQERVGSQALRCKKDLLGSLRQKWICPGGNQGRKRGPNYCFCRQKGEMIWTIIMNFWSRASMVQGIYLLIDSFLGLPRLDSDQKTQTCEIFCFVCHFYHDFSSVT